MEKEAADNVDYLELDSVSGKHEKGIDYQQLRALNKSKLC